MAEDDPPICGHVVAPVVEPFGRCRAIGVQREDLRRDHLAIESIGDEVAAYGGHDEPRGADRFAARKRGPRHRDRARHRDRDPDGDREDLRHVRCPRESDGGKMLAGRVRVNPSS